jgi:hypothetical protein
MRSPCCLSPQQTGIVEAEEMAVFRQWLGKHSHGYEYTCNNRRTVGPGVLCGVCVISDTQAVVKGKQVTSVFPDFLFIMI